MKEIKKLPIQNLYKEKKKKSNNMAPNVTKIYKQMKKINGFSIEKMLQNEKNASL